MDTQKRTLECVNVIFYSHYDPGLSESCVRFKTNWIGGGKVGTSMFMRYSVINVDAAYIYEKNYRPFDESENIPEKFFVIPNNHITFT